MKALIAFVILSSLYFKVDPEPVHFRVDQETFNKCRFSSEKPCIKIDGRPVRLVFGKDDEFDIIQTASDSIFGGVKVIVLKHSEDTGIDSTCARSESGSTCFVIKQDTLVLLPPEMGLESEPVVLEGWRELRLTPNFGPTEGDVELYK